MSTLNGREKFTLNDVDGGMWDITSLSNETGQSKRGVLSLNRALMSLGIITIQSGFVMLVV